MVTFGTAAVQIEVALSHCDLYNALGYKRSPLGLNNMAVILEVATVT